jgi:hypothetical protein
MNDHKKKIELYASTIFLHNIKYFDDLFKAQVFDFIKNGFYKIDVSEFSTKVIEYFLNKLYHIEKLTDNVTLVEYYIFCNKYNIFDHTFIKKFNEQIMIFVGSITYENMDLMLDSIKIINLIAGNNQTKILFSYHFIYIMKCCLEIIDGEAYNKDNYVFNMKLYWPFIIKSKPLWNKVNDDKIQKTANYILKYSSDNLNFITTQTNNFYDSLIEYENKYKDSTGGPMLFYGTGMHINTVKFITSEFALIIGALKGDTFDINFKILTYRDFHRFLEKFYWDQGNLLRISFSNRDDNFQSIRQLKKFMCFGKFNFCPIKINEKFEGFLSDIQGIIEPYHYPGFM